MAKKEKKFAKAVKRQELILSKEEIEQKAKDIFKFLRLVHPSASDKEGTQKEAIELRFLLRGDGLTSGSLISYNTWHLEEKDLEHLIKKLTQYNGYSVCTYYSPYTYDLDMMFEKVIKDKDGNAIETKMEQPKKIRKESVKYTESLPADFDNLSKEEFDEEKERFLSVGIETLDLFSGHGFQSSVLLNDRCYDPDALENFTKLLLRKGFKVDPKIDHPNHIMRTPFTNNCKEYAKDMPKYYKPNDPQPYATYVVNWTEKRYNLVDVMEKLEQLEDKPFDDMDDLFDAFGPGKLGSAGIVKDEPEAHEVASGAKTALKSEPKEEKKIKSKPKVEIKVESKEDVAELYEYFDLLSLPEAIQNILMGSPKDFRNDTLFFIVPFLRNTLGLSRKEGLETLKIWGELCEPPYGEDKLVDDFERCWDLNVENKSKAKYGKYTPEMRKLYGVLEFDTIVRDDEEIIINNDFFRNIEGVSSQGLKFYIALRYMQHYYKEEKRTNFSKEEIMKFWKWADTTFTRYANAAKKENLASRKLKVNEEGKRQAEFYPNPFFSSKGSYGFTAIKAALIDDIIKEKFRGNEPVFYLYLKHLTNNRGKECFTSQRELAKRFKIKQAALSLLTDRLHEIRYLKKIGSEKKYGSCTYRLLK